MDGGADNSDFCLYLAGYIQALLARRLKALVPLAGAYSSLVKLNT